jgi:hypothetical protein
MRITYFAGTGRTCEVSNTNNDSALAVCALENQVEQLIFFVLKVSPQGVPA